MLVRVHVESGLASHEVFVSSFLDDSRSLGVVGFDVCRVMIGDDSFCDGYSLDSLNSIDMNRLVVSLVSLILRCDCAACQKHDHPQDDPN